MFEKIPAQRTKWSEAAGREAVIARSGGVCEICQANRATNFAHRQRRSQGGSWSPVNGLALCGSGTTGCHGWCTAHPALARAGGWEVGAWGDPTEEPVYLQHFGWYAWWWLKDEGLVMVEEDFPVPTLPPTLHSAPRCV